MGVDVVKDEIYYWCSCGNSGTQPFCDGAHQLCYQSLSTGIGPYEYIAPETKTVYFCGCKQSGSIPLCDGSHGKLPKDAEGKSLKKNT
jgi:CDGSH-type Zn-finger protein